MIDDDKSNPSTDVRPAASESSAAVPTGHPAPRPDRLPAIPGYEVLGKLGAGGMGVVYQARHLALHRLVAIKVLSRIQEASEREVARLQVEGETVANLQHPNIVQLYQLGEVAGLPFLAFEYVDGGTLAERIAGQPQSPRSRRNAGIAGPGRAGGPSARSAAPRFETRQCAVEQGRRAQDRGFRSRPANGQCRVFDRADCRHGQLHVARASLGRQPNQSADAGDGRLFAGRRSLRAADGQTSVRGRFARAGDQGRLEQESAAATADRGRHSRRLANDLPQMPGEGAESPLRERWRVGRRSAPLPAQRADPGPADRQVRTSRALVPARSAVRRAGRGTDRGDSRGISREQLADRHLSRTENRGRICGKPGRTKRVRGEAECRAS